MTPLRFYILVVFIAVSHVVFAQPKAVKDKEKSLPGRTGFERIDLLNELAYGYITEDSLKVLQYCSEAIELSRELGYLNGEAQATIYRGVHRYLSGQFNAAHQDLHTGIRLARSAGNEALVGYAYLQLGNCSLEEVEEDSALIYLRKSYRILRDSPDSVTLSKVYRNLSAVHGQRHQPDSQQFYLDKAIHIRRAIGDGGLLAEALALKANIALRNGDYIVAESILREARHLAESSTIDGETKNDINHLSALLDLHQGKFDEGLALFDSARSYYFSKGLLRKYVTLMIDMGRLFRERGRYELALNNLYEALKLSKLKNFEVEAMIVRNEIGWVNFHLGDLQQALNMSTEVLDSDSKKLMLQVEADALMLRGVVQNRMGMYALARRDLNRVMAIHQRLDNRRGISEAFLNLGVLEQRRGNLEESIRLFEQSIQLASSISEYAMQAWSYWGMAETYMKLGDQTKAAAFLDRSLHFAQLIGAHEIRMKNYISRRDLLVSERRFEEALHYSTLAGQLGDSIHRSDLSRRFADLEKIAEIEIRDRNIQLLEKERQLATDQLQIQNAKLKQQYILLVTGCVALVLVGVLAVVYYRFYSRIKVLNVAITEKNSQIQAQADRLRDVNDELKQLYQEVSEQKEKIQLQADELAQSNENMSEINRSLEKIVAEKTLEVRKTNDELIKHNTELLQFSYTVSHNLRAPVARLLGLAGLAQVESDIKQAKQWINLIHTTASDLDLIIKDLSDLLDLRNTPHQVRELVNLEEEWTRSRNLLQDGLTGSEQIITDFELPELVTVRPIIQSIFYNLLSNAMKFRSPDRTLRVVASSRVDDRNAVLEVVDNGLGFNTDQHAAQLFRLYKRFHTHVAGRGLGLYLIKSQLEVLHGSIEVESQPGKGSRFRVVLPLEVEELVMKASLPN